MRIIKKVVDIVVLVLKMNFFWILFTILGLGLFGFGPSTYTLYKIVKEEKYDFTFSDYFKIYKSNLFDANLLSISYLIILSIIGYNLAIYFDMIEYLGVWVIIFLIIFLLVINSFIIIYPLDITFKYDNNFKLVRSSFIIPFVFPIKTLSFFVSISALAIIYFYVPYLMIIGIVPLVYLTNSYVNSINDKMNKHIEKRSYS